ncbi:hypothetical protein DRW07_02805 [Alteromonas sediminis]|uniref:Uncharacterized protein n=1 Tax=Alteromonas sediminis TaxID=2259342 RepID=A0A3N5Y5I4_9ALTE|nr:hypothetical protein [Alteromonas sediminis]RPJ68356.1 hypothetical protein DRW07_02805 [Alteromonas sediminis]
MKVFLTSGLVTGLLVLLTMLIHLTMFKGVKVGTVEGKVVSIESALIITRKYSQRGLVNYANVTIDEQEAIPIEVYCISICNKDDVIKVDIYSPLFGGDLNFVYEKGS